MKESLDKALKKLPKEHHLMIQTGKGFHYQHRSWVETLEKYNVTQSMSRQSNCLDNAPMKIFLDN